MTCKYCEKDDCSECSVYISHYDFFNVINYKFSINNQKVKAICVSKMPYCTVVTELGVLEVCLGKNEKATNIDDALKIFKVLGKSKSIKDLQNRIKLLNAID